MRPASLIALMLLFSPTAATAQSAQTPHVRCARMRAMAESQAYVLASPTVWVEGVHVPRVGDETGMALVQGGEWQLRGALSWSPLDLARGVMLLDQTGTECTALGASTRVRRTLELGATLGELQARRAELAVLTEAMPRVQEILEQARTRASEGLGTQAQVMMLESESVRLERRLAQLHSEIDRLVEEGNAEVDASQVETDLALYESSSMQLERQRSTYRRMSPWIVQVRGGVVPTGQADWFGQVQVGYNLGGIAQQFSEDAVLAARQAELAEDADELRHHVERLEHRLAESLPELRAELEHAERLIALTEHQQGLLGQLETSDVAQMRALLEVQLITLRAERAHWAELLAQRSALVAAADTNEEGPRP